MESRGIHPLIAIIDDDAAIVDWAVDLLTDASYRVMSATNRDTAYDRLRQQRPDVILVDLHMDHRGEGWVLLDLLQATPALVTIPVILWSADASALHARAHRITAKGWQWLTKPCTPTQVLAAIEHSRGALAPSAGCGMSIRDDPPPRPQICGTRGPALERSQSHLVLREVWRQRPAESAAPWQPGGHPRRIGSIVATDYATSSNCMLIEIPTHTC